MEEEAVRGEVSFRKRLSSTAQILLANLAACGWRRYIVLATQETAQTGAERMVDKIAL